MQKAANGHVLNGFPSQGANWKHMVTTTTKNDYKLLFVGCLDEEFA
jgi:hypothetical protein